MAWFNRSMKPPYATRAFIVTSAMLWLVARVAMADTFTLAIVTNSPSYANFEVASNMTAQVAFAYLPGNSSLSIKFPGAPYWTTFPFPSGIFQQGTPPIMPSSYLPIVAGPATIQVSGSVGAFCTIQTTSATSLTPSTSVVIPNDGGGPVTIILESSVDLITWTPALPGTYGTSSTNRFFRVRAQR